MNLRDLQYFAALAETKHFGEAAKRCFVSQPTLSMQIKKLEDELGVVLFERTNKQVFLTEHGQLMVQGGMGVTLLPALSVLTHASDLLSYIPFNEPAPSRTLSLFWRSSSPKHQCLQAIADQIKGTLKSCAIKQLDEF